MAYFVSTLVATQASANKMAYTFVLMTIIFQIVFSQQDINNLFLYNDKTSNTPFVRIFRGFFNLVPSFTFSVCFGAIVKVAATHFDPHLIIWVPGKRYTWTDFTTRETGSVVMGVGYTMPSAFESLLVMMGDVLLYAALAWYFDHILSHNRGVADPWYFPFTAKYWSGLTKQDKGVKGAIKEARKIKKKAGNKVDKIIKEDYSGDLNLNDNNNVKQKDSVKKEKMKVKNGEMEGVECDGLRVIGLRKTYFKKSFGRKSAGDVHAVRGIYLEIPDRELLCLLGHNGAGKSTTFSMLTGVTDPTEGTAKIFGFDIRTQIEEIRLIMGVVPQFDILWGELTAAEHMTMFSMIKGVHPEDIEEMTDELLGSVGLLEVKHARVMNYSGGMKRRLSVAISSIGNPRIIFMDEPTTGMDPVSRRDVWNLIQKLKRNKVIVLSTHAMEEADILSDRIAVVCDGKLKCVGTPLYLKNAYGDGYRISLVCDPGNEQQIMDLMSRVAPGCRLIDESGGSMVFSVGMNNT
jgi:ABC-type multidrug transport system ATPase subunit